jgi:pyruvate dehydrogenase E2 component (dihydrolipoamide acetyltransferase)
MAAQFKLPNLGENIDSGDVVRVLVQVGDQITKQQPLLELETDKAVIEVPSSMVGTVEEIHVKEGDKAEVGQLILTVEEGQEKETKKEKPESKPPPTQKTLKTQEPKTPEPVKAEKAAAKKGKKPAKTPKTSGAEVVDFAPVPTEVPVLTEVPVNKPEQPVPAAPSVRRFARQIGVDIHDIKGSGPRDRISIDDVKDHSRRLHQAAEPTATPAEPEAVPLPDFTKWGEVERKPISNVRRKTAEHVSLSWRTIPHVTQYDKADITRLEQARKLHGRKVEAAGGKLTVTAIMVKVVASALNVFPQFNASIDLLNKEIIYKQYCHIGVAVDTDRGLLVPVIRDVDQKNIMDLSVELSEIAVRARDAKLTLEEMQGGSFTISNLGGIGGTYFSPIINAPEVAILGISRGKVEPVDRDGEWTPRLMVPLSLSYDHRLIDGADAARFLRWVGQALEDPFLISLEG